MSCKRSRIRKVSDNHRHRPSLVGIPGQLICKSCLPAERAAALDVEVELDELSGDEQVALELD